MNRSRSHHPIKGERWGDSGLGGVPAILPLALALSLSLAVLLPACLPEIQKGEPPSGEPAGADGATGADGTTGADGATDSTVNLEPPPVTAVYPIDEAGSIDRYGSVIVTFSIPMDTVALEEAFSLRDDAAEVDGVLSWNGVRTQVTFTPSAMLSALTTYVVSIIGRTGEAFGSPTEDFTSQFTTAAKWTEVAASGWKTLAMKSDGILWKVVEDEFRRQGYSFTTMATGHDHVVGLKTGGTLWIWGDGLYGQLGGIPAETVREPTQVGEATDWSAVAVGYQSNLALKSNGFLWAWGGNGYGNLGTGDYSFRYDPVQVGTDSDWVAIAAGNHHSLGLKSDGTLWACGDNGQNLLGITPSESCLSANVGEEQNCTSTPAKVGTDTDWVAIEINDDKGFSQGRPFSLALKEDGTLWGWGKNQLGQLGLGGYRGSVQPGQIGRRSRLEHHIGRFIPHLGAESGWLSLELGLQ